MSNSEPLCILGGGLSALSFAHFSKLPAVIFEKEDRIGGLCRSFEANGVAYDVGPHIVFSKDKQILELQTSLSPMSRIRRASKVFYKGRLVKYPFENDLFSLPEDDRRLCLDSFINNPYENYPPSSMLAFFYKTFGEGIVRCYLEPYNRKIWKFEPAFMDTQIVERIPKPPKEDVIASANGAQTEGYTHQLYFNYPVEGGIESMVRGLRNACADRLEIHCNAPLERIVRQPGGGYVVTAAGQTRHFERVISTMPIHEMIPLLEPQPPADVLEALAALKFNSIHITIVQTAQDKLGDNYSCTLPQPEIAFHRISKTEFLGASYHRAGTSTIMAEITYRQGDRYDLSPDEISKRVVRDLLTAGFIPNEQAVKHVETRSFTYAYVIYDLNHRANCDKVIGWLQDQGIQSLGRFARFEYINMDQAMLHARELAQEWRNTIYGHVKF